MAREGAETEALRERPRDVPAAFPDGTEDAAHITGWSGIPNAGNMTPGIVREAIVVVENIIVAGAASIHYIASHFRGCEATIAKRRSESNGTVVFGIHGRLKKRDRERPDRRAQRRARGNDEAAGLAGVIAQLVHHRVAGRRRGGGDAGVGDRHRVAVGLVRLVGVPAARGGVGRVGAGAVHEELVHVPDADIVRARPDEGRGGETRRRAGGVPVHLDCRGVGKRRHRDPDERVAGCVPGVDVAGNRVVARVREPDAARRGAVRIEEAGRRVIREPHKDGEVSERG